MNVWCGRVCERVSARVLGKGSRLSSDPPKATTSEGRCSRPITFLVTRQPPSGWGRNPGDLNSPRAPGQLAGRKKARGSKSEVRKRKWSLGRRQGEAFSWCRWRACGCCPWMGSLAGRARGLQGQAVKCNLLPPSRSIQAPGGGDGPHLHWGGKCFTHFFQNHPPGHPQRPCLTGYLGNRWPSQVDK